MQHVDMKINEKRRNHLVDVLSDVFNELCKRNDPRCGNQVIRSSFCSALTPLVKLKPYLWRIANYTGCSEESLVLSLIYIDRMITRKGRKSLFMVTSHNAHRLVLTSVLVAAKFYDDHYYNNALFAKVGGVSCEELNKLEMAFLLELNFELSVDMKVYERYNKSLMEHKLISSRVPPKPIPSSKPSAARSVQAFGRQLYTNATKKLNSGSTKPILHVKKRSGSRPSSASLAKPSTTCRKQVNYRHVQPRFRNPRSPVRTRCFGVSLFYRHNTCKPLVCYA